MKKQLLLAIIAFYTNFTLSAIDIYVSPTRGNDANNGTLAAPMKTIESAVFSVQNNIKTIIHIENNSIIKLGAKLNFGQNKKVEIVGNNVTLKAADLAAQKDPSGLPLLGQGNRIIEALDNCDLKIKGITFLNGRQIGYLPGGAIFFAGNTLEVDSCKFIDNQAGSCGGAIGARAKAVIVKNSYFQGDNILGGGARGAAIMQAGPALETAGTLSVQNCTFYNCTTQTHGYGFVISIYDSSLSNEGGSYSNTKKLEVTNCTFMENSSPTAYQAAIDVSDGDCEVVLVNNTFYKNSQCAFRLLMNKAYLANNVIIGGKQGVMSELTVASGRPEIVAVNNISVGTEGGINGSIDDACFTSAASANHNIVNTITAYSLTNIGLATSLSTDNFVPYLAINSSASTLINAGQDDTSLKFGVNYVPAVDIRGHLTSQTKDIGAYEYSGITGLSTPDYSAEDYIVTQFKTKISVKNIADKSFTVSIININGQLVYTTSVKGLAEIPTDNFAKGIFILLFNNKDKLSSNKILI